MGGIERTPSRWAKYRWWFAAALMVYVVLIGFVLLFSRGSGDRPFTYALY